MPSQYASARRWSVLLAAVAVTAGVLPVGAEPTGRDLRITVYNSNLGVVSDRRGIEVKSGQSSFELADVPALIDPTSVHLKAPGGELSVLEQNFQYDLAGSDRILQRYLDANVEAVFKGGDLRSGSLLSFDGGTLVLRGSDGAVNLVNRAETMDLRLPSLPSGLRTRPTLVWWLDSRKGGTVPVELSYMTEGLNWHAEYVAVTNEKDTAIELSAWVSLENNSGASYENAELQLVAGEVQRVAPPQPMFKRGRVQMDAMAMAAPEQGFEEESFFEYHLYTLGRRTTLADRETKQIALFPTASGPVRKLYEYDGQRDAKKVSVLLETENKAELGLGMPLPAGKVRTYKADSRGLLQFIGEDQIDHTPRNEKVRLRMGNAFDVVGERADKEQRRISDRAEERDVEIKLRNRKDEAVQVIVREHFWGSWTLVRSSLPSTKKDASTAEFQVDVPRDGEAVLTFTVRTQW
ncbi:MAG: DUF4139 domain-containing protein [Candidatus Eisenbacteria bacterium]|nr:DUF4139 domain-containing protein [Candidatus Eisenbacteria bacterium]